MFSSKKISLSDIKQLTPSYMGASVDINKPVKFGHLWKLIDDQKDFLCQYTRIPYLNELISEINSIQTKDINKDESWKLEYIELFYEVGTCGGEFYGNWVVHGIGTYNGEPANLALDFSSLNELKDFDVVFKKEVVIGDFSKIEGIEINKINIPSIPTVLDVLDAIIYEFSFYGDPSSRNTKFDELKKITENAIGATIPHEEVSNRIEKKIKDIKESKNGNQHNL